MIGFLAHESGEINVVLNAVALAVIVGGAILGVIVFGRWKATSAALEAALTATQAELEVYVEKANRLESENAELRQRVTVLESRTDITKLQQEAQQFHVTLLEKLELISGALASSTGAMERSVGTLSTKIGELIELGKGGA